VSMPGCSSSSTSIAGACVRNGRPADRSGAAGAFRHRSEVASHYSLPLMQVLPPFFLRQPACNALGGEGQQFVE
jgi:hypothetical protein